MINLNQRTLAELGLHLPVGVDEQSSIARALTDADALIESLEQLLTKKRQIKQGAMQELLTGQRRLPGFVEVWAESYIGDFTDCTAGGTPSTREERYWGGTVPWMSSGDLHLKRVSHVDGRITEEGLENSSTKWIPAGCVLIGLAGQGKTRGTVAMNLIPLCTNQSIAAIFPTAVYDMDFLYHNLDWRYEELRELSAGDGGRGGLNLTLIRSIIVPRPSMEEQQAIAQALSDMDTDITVLESRLTKARALKQAMAQALLTGRIRLVEPTA
jgi:type I restriction enzyme S subunit